MTGDDTANLEAMSAAVAYQHAMAQLVVRELGLDVGSPEEGVLLDFGAGRGDYARALQAHTNLRVVGLEPDASQHLHYPASVPVVSQLEQLSDAPCAGYSLNVLEHIVDDVAALRSLADHCAPGALVFLLVPAHPQLWTAMDTLVGHQRRYTPETLRDCVTQAGLAVLREGWFDRTGYWATRVYQWLAKVRPWGDRGSSASQAGRISRTQVQIFDVVFRLFEPLLPRRAPGKNCWVLAQCPARIPSKLIAD